MGSGPGDTTQLQKMLDRASQGDHSVYDEVIDLAAVRLQRLTGKMLQSYPHLRRWEETADIFQTAVVRLHRSLSDVRPDTVQAFFGLAALQIRRTLIDLARHTGQTTLTPAEFAKTYGWRNDPTNVKLVDDANSRDQGKE